jgi:uncharacterized protein
MNKIKEKGPQESAAIGGETVEIEYQYRFGLPRPIVWKYIKNEKVLKNSLPGCKSISETSPGVYVGEMEINMGPIQDHFKLQIQLAEENPPAVLRLKLNGNGNLGQMKGTALLMLKENQGVTQLTCKAKGELSGALGLAGKRLLDSGVTKGVENFFLQLEKEIKRKLFEIKKRNR